MHNTPAAPPISSPAVEPCLSLTDFSFPHNEAEDSKPVIKSDIFSTIFDKSESIEEFNSTFCSYIRFYSYCVVHFMIVESLLILFHMMMS